MSGPLIVHGGRRRACVRGTMPVVNRPGAVMNEEQMDRLVRELRRPRLVDKLAAGAVAWWLGGLLAFPLVCLLGYLLLAWPGGGHAASAIVRWLDRVPPMGLILGVCVLAPAAGKLLGAVYLKVREPR